MEALEDTALDRARLARGRAYADRGHVDAITVTPGRVMAYVHGSRPRPYRTEIRLRTLSDDDWDDFLDAAAARPDHIAALLDKDMPHALATVGGPAARAAATSIPDCSCPDDGYPCKHAAALCYQTARLLDEDPFVLFLMRGRGEREILAELARRNAGPLGRRAHRRRAADCPTVPAREALAARSLPAAARRRCPRPPHPGRRRPTRTRPARPTRSPWTTSPPTRPPAPTPSSPPATTRIAGLTPWQDAVRLAAAHPGSGLTASTRALYRDLASATGRTPTDLARAVAAWRQGGLAGLAVLEEPWDPPAGPFDRARPALARRRLPALPPLAQPPLHAASLQLRFGRDGLWYGYESDPDREDWWPRGTPDTDPVGALTALLGR